MKIRVIYKGLEPIEFEYEDIERIEEVTFEQNKSVFISLKDNRKVLLPISQNEFEEKIKNSRGLDVVFEFDI